MGQALSQMGMSPYLNYMSDMQEIQYNYQLGMQRLGTERTLGLRKYSTAKTLGGLQAETTPEKNEYNYLLGKQRSIN